MKSNFFSDTSQSLSLHLVKCYCPEKKICPSVEELIWCFLWCKLISNRISVFFFSCEVMQIATAGSSGRAIINKGKENRLGKNGEKREIEKNVVLQQSHFGFNWTVARKKTLVTFLSNYLATFFVLFWKGNILPLTVLLAFFWEGYFKRNKFKSVLCQWWFKGTLKVKRKVKAPLK